MKERMWEIKQSATPGTLELYIYGYVQSDSYDWWEGEVIKSETSANAFREELNKNKDVSQIDIYINSYGGSVYEGTAIYSQLRRHQAFKTVYIDGFACSIASVIAMAGDKIVMPRNTMMMIHNMMLCACGNAKELRKHADDLDVMMEGNRQAYLQKAGDKLSEEKLIDMLEAETWLTAAQCVDLGLADEFSEKDVDLKQANEMLQQMSNSLQQSISYHQALVNQYKEFVQSIKFEPVQKKSLVPEPETDLKPVEQIEKSSFKQFMAKTSVQPITKRGE